MSRTGVRVFGIAAAGLGLAAGASAQPADPLAAFFGFDPMRIVSIDPNCGPVTIADFNGDGRPDIAVVNNRKSRIEVHYLRVSERSLEDMQAEYRVNELPPNPWYDRSFISVRHRVGALAAIDADGDGRMDLLYAGTNPEELVVLAQKAPGEFEVAARRRVPGLAAGPKAFAVADVLGDERPEILALVRGRIAIFTLLPRPEFSEPVFIGAEGAIAEFQTGDFDGDGLRDILGMARGSETPLRLWLQTQDPNVRGRRAGILPREYRFEMPQLQTIASVSVPGHRGDHIAVLESASRRLVLHQLVSETFDGVQAGASIDREVQAEVGGFVDGSSKLRSIALADIDGDGRIDLLATDHAGNAIVLHRQAPGVGFSAGVSFPTFKKPLFIAVGQWDGGGVPEVFVLSNEEKTVGVASYDPQTGRLDFPRPLPLLTPGASPEAMQYAVIDGLPTVAIVVKQRRDLALELHHPSGSGREPTVIPLPGITEAPKSILVADADRDGLTDLLLLTPNQPMIMVRGKRDGSSARPTEVLTRNEMKQFGLVQAAGPENTILLDSNGDGSVELLIADENFVRACVYDENLGWRVVSQVNVPGASTRFVSLARLDETDNTAIVAADRDGSRLMIFRQDRTGAWQIADRVRLLGFPVGPVWAGQFAGDDRPGVLCIGEDGFALVRLAGRRIVLDQVAAHRADSENRREHFVASGDLNGDGFVDVVVLDAREQMCSILSISKARRLLPATEFKVFESRLFSRGDANQFEPSAAIVRDLTGNGRDDLLLVVHDRILVYPQATRR
ncbi:MAG: VCBS repeat-containing protein [Phycisphaeraceae bacterium]|nr:VCBS repeat-containing protein [Phycisphaeraceae bacterium]MCW5755266.1 VCBS repeat-containing protein [Phycisphaeraceae bacterium]